MTGDLKGFKMVAMTKKRGNNDHCVIKNVGHNTDSISGRTQSDEVAQ